jgi:hypothetical protein
MWRIEAVAYCSGSLTAEKLFERFIYNPASDSNGSCGGAVWQGSEPDARLIWGKQHDTSRGSPRFPRLRSGRMRKTNIGVG